MTNAEKFKNIFGLYATELWAKSEKEFLKWLNTETQETYCENLVDRQAAIDELTRFITPHNNGDGTITIGILSKSSITNILNDLPPAQPQRKKGKWIKITTGAMREKYMCSICGRIIEEDGIEKLVQIRYPFCHCGAEMTKEYDE